MNAEPMVTPAWIEHQLDIIRNLAADGDYENAHQTEDEMYEKLLRWIAYGNYSDPRHVANLANLALKSQLIDFSRYCA